MAEMAAETEPFPGYTTAVQPMREQIEAGGVPTAAVQGPQTSPAASALLTALMTPARQSEKPANDPPKWMWFLPGFGKGVAMRRQMDAQSEDLKLRKQQLAGQEAAQKLQQLAMQHKIESQQAAKRWTGMYAGLIQHEDVLDPTAVRELEGRMVQEMAQQGDPEKVEKFLKFRQHQKLLRQLAQAEQAQAQQQGMTAPLANAEEPFGAGDNAPAPGLLSGASPVPAQAPIGGETAPTLHVGVAAWQRDRMELARMQQQAQTLEQTLRGYTRFAQVPEAKPLLEAKKAELVRLREDIKQLNTRVRVKGTAAEQIAGVPEAYLDPADLPRIRDFEKPGLVQDRMQKQIVTTAARTFAREDKLRDEFQTLTKTYRIVADGYGRVIASAADPTAAGDIALVYSYMKILDPGSVVREGEFATAQNAGGIPERIIAQYNKLLTGERLEKTVRQDFVDRAERLYDQETKSYNKIREQYRQFATRNQLDPDNVIMDFTSPSRGPGQPPAAPASTAVVGPTKGRVTAATIDATMASENARRTARGEPPVTRADTITALQKAGYEVP